MTQDKTPSTLAEALNIMGQRPGPGMDMVAAVALVNGVPTELAHQSNLNTILDQGVLALLIFQTTAINAPKLNPKALSEGELTELVSQGYTMPPDQLMRIISTYMTQEEADTWLEHADQDLAYIQKGARDAETAYGIAGTLRGAAQLSAQHMRERIRRDGNTISPSTEALIQHLEAFAAIL